MAADYIVTVALKRDHSVQRQIGPIFTSSSSDAEAEARTKMKKGEFIYDVSVAGDSSRTTRKKIQEED
jgi:hypothetical protein